MSQQLTPISGGVQVVQTAVSEDRLLVLSPQYIEVNNLHSRPTEWVSGGRPIYRRLPAISETYQIDFFNLVPAPNTAAASEVQDIGYTYIPWGEGINGPYSMEVVSSDNHENILIKSGVVVWQYGKNSVNPVIINLRELGILSGKYDVAYQLVYDDSPKENLYSVEDYSLSGLPLNIMASTDSSIGWRYPAVNAFLNTSDNRWSNSDTYFPSYAQPSSNYLQWESNLAAAYSKITLRCPVGTAYTGTASLYYVVNSTQVLVSSVGVSSDNVSQYFEFTVDAPSFERGWRVGWSNLDISIQSVTVSGVVTLLEPQAAPSTRCTLVMYPSGTLPKVVLNSNNDEIKATYCVLAQVDVSSAYLLEDITDVRYIIHRDYTPVADWLTRPFDDTLISLYEQVDDYSNLWMNPTVCMKQEYLGLEKEQITVEN
jgi:hypothetical protein